MASSIYIVDPKTGNIKDPQVHALDGPFIMTNWFDGQQSVNIINSQRYVFATDQNVSSVKFTLGTDSKFYFIDESELGTVHQIDDQDFYDIDSQDFKTHSLSFLTPSAQIGTIYNLWTVVVCIQAEEAGTFLDELSIELDTDKPVYITIGADCYNEDEILTSNLQNMGVEIPSSIQKSIHTTNVHEDLNDNILLNRKKRELLMNYWNVVAGKGSYKSLIDSLKWFEYGDLVRIEQYWKSDVGGKEMFIGDDLETFLDDTLEYELGYKIKTTYDGLYLLLNRNIEGYDSELNPLTENLNETVLLWTEKDFSLKMTLLGNFFSTYFMPIHLSLLHSTIERRVYAYCIQLLSAARTFRNDYFKANCPLLLTLHNNEPEFYLEDTNAYVYMNTIFGVHNPLNDFSNTEFIGVEPLKETEVDTNMTDADFSRNMFSGIGKMVRFDVEIPTNWTDPNDVIWKQTIYITKDGGSYKHTTSYVTIHPIDISEDEDPIWTYDFNFNILFTEVGEYILSVSFETLNSKTYTGTIGLTISDAGNCELVPYLVKRLDAIENSVTDFPNEILFNNFAFRNTDDPSLFSLPLEPLFVVSTRNSNLSEIGLNHYIAFIVDDNYELYDEHHGSNDPCSVLTSELPSVIKGNLENYAPYYFWDVRYVNTANDYNTVPAYPEPQSGPILVRGIKKEYSSDDNEEYSIHLYLNGARVNSGMIDNDVFFPILHEITPLEEPCKITQSQTIAIVPTFERSFEVDGDNANWTFFKRYGNQQIACAQNIAPRQPFVGDYEPQELDRGYWSVNYSIVQNGTNVRTIKGNSLFKVE